MKEKWEIIFYKTLQGDTPVNDFIRSLEIKARSKVSDVIELLQEFGLQVGPPHAKKLIGSELWELRIVGSDSVRLFYVAISGKNFLLLHGFKKKKNKTPRKEIKVAEERLTEFRLRR